MPVSCYLEIMRSHTSSIVPLQLIGGTGILLEQASSQFATV
ncbi:hypothetical protein [Moorena producens]|nr:hypothetical protein [Moorena producens]